MDEVKNVGLPGVDFRIIDGHFAVIFTGPGKTLSKLRPIKPRALYAVAPADVDRLNDNQKKSNRRRRVALAKGNYVVVIGIGSKGNARFITAFFADGRRTIEMIRRNPKWA